MTMATQLTTAPLEIVAPGDGPKDTRGDTPHNAPDDAPPSSPGADVKPRTRRRKTPELGAEFNEVEDVIMARRSVRAYRKKQVPEHLVHRVLEAGRFAPCAGNNQSWKFVVVRDAATLDGMTAHVQKWARRLASFFDPTVPGAIAGERLAKLNNRLLSRLAPGPMHPTGLAGLAEVAKGNLGVWHGAPTVVLLLVDTRGPGKPYLDVGIAGQNMVLAAHSMGLGTCWVSFAMFLEQGNEYKKLLGIDYPYRLATSIAIGFPRGNPDGYVERETHETVWIEDQGIRKVTY